MTQSTVKIPKGYPMAGRRGRIVADLGANVDVMVWTENRTTPGGPKSKIVRVAIHDIAA